jgi:hypothetical protein
MTKWTLLFFGLLILTSCSNQEREILTLIESEWIQIDNQSKSLFDSADIGLVFRRDTVWSTSDRGWFNQGQYSFDKNEILLASKSDTTNLIIQLFTKDSLTLLTNEVTYRYYNRRLEFNKDLKFRKITLKTGVCFGGCQSFDVVLDNEGNVKFNGLENGNAVDLKNYSIDLKTKEKIDSLFKQSRVGSLDSSKFYGWFDDWTMKIKFEYGDNNVKEITGTRSYMPYRLKPIIGTLISDLRKRELIK